MKKGFTLIELLVVVLIIGILSSVALPQYTKAVEKSRATEAITLLGNLATAEQIYYMSQNKFSADLTELDLELPGIVSGTTSTANTKNFNLAVFAPNSGNFIATATRANNGTAITSGDNAYSISMIVTPDGTITRWCAAAAATSSTTAAPTENTTTMCKSIANGDAKGLLK